MTSPQSNEKVEKWTILIQSKSDNSVNFHLETVQVPHLAVIDLQAIQPKNEFR